MGDLPLIYKVSVLTLFAADAVVLVLRIRTCNARRELVLFLALLASLALRFLVPAGSAAGAVLSVFTIWVSGRFLTVISGVPGRPGWTAACAAFSALTLSAFAPGIDPRVREVFRAYSLGLLGILPVVLLVRVWRESRSGVDALFLAATVLLFASEEVRTLGAVFSLSLPDAGPHLAAVVGAAAAYSLFQDGYLLSSGWRGWEARRAGHEKLMRAANRRILQTENALALQDRLVVSGLLVMGAAHDFKNSLTQIRATAGHALTPAGAGKSEEALRLIAEHTESGAAAAVSFLERFSRAGRDEAGACELSTAITRFLTSARAAFRTDGVGFEADLHPVRAWVRWAEIEQVLLNLCGNAVEGFRRLASRQRVIRVICRALPRAALLEVSDTAGGMAPDAAARLFQVTPSESGTGLGLYLSRCLLDRNGGTLSYCAVPGGSCFRITLPLADGETAQQARRDVGPHQG